MTNASVHAESRLAKCPTGIQGLDEITDGGLPWGRPTLVCGRAGCGKTLLAMEFVVRGARQYDEPGVFVSFEESEAELMSNVASLGWDLQALADEEKFVLDHVHIEPSEIEETGEYGLEGLFIRLESAIFSIQARRVVLDTIEALFGGFRNQAILRAELRRLFRWLKEKGVTALITGESGEDSLTRHGIEEYVSDCVIELDHRIVDQVGTRHLRVVKYRGSSHGTNEYPFLIGENGLSVLPITSLGLDYEVSEERISTGIARLDAMLGGEGPYRGSSILVSGTAGTGKTSLAASFARATCQRGERCLFFSFEEAPKQIVRNMRSVDIDLGPHLESGLLRFHTMRVSAYGLEVHLALIHQWVEAFAPQLVVIDPISNLPSVGTEEEAKNMLCRVIDFLKMKGITALFTDLSHVGSGLEITKTAISSLMDTWLLLRDIESGGERNRGLYVLKSRGMAHSNQIREFVLTDQGIDLLEVYLGPEGVLTGTARVTQEVKEEADRWVRDQEIQRLQREVERNRAALEAQVAALRASFESAAEELNTRIAQARAREERLAMDREVLARMRGADASSSEA